MIWATWGVSWAARDTFENILKQIETDSVTRPKLAKYAALLRDEPEWMMQMKGWDIIEGTNMPPH